MYPAGYIEIHASACGERFVHEHKEFANIQPLLIIVISKAAVIGWKNWYIWENMLSPMYFWFTKCYLLLSFSQCPDWDSSDVDIVDVDTAEEPGPSGIASQTTPNQILPTTSSASLSDFTDEEKGL